MAKGANNVSKKRSDSSKPYDVSNSFVKQVASRVSNLLPQTSWLNRWLAPTNPTEEEADFLPTPVLFEDDDASTEYPPPTKRARIPLHQSFSADNFLISRTSNRNDSVEANSKANLSCFQDVQEEAGPSGLSGFPRSRLVSSTPATQSMPSSSHTAQITPIANGDDRSDSGESTSGCSSLVPQGTRHPYSNESANLSAGSVRRASVDEKDFSTYLQNSRSIFPNRITPSLCVNSSPNPRQGPSFNSSLYTLPFATRSPSIDKSFSSPFYPGPTAYGGASASRKRRSGFFSPNEILPVTQSIQVKPVNRSNSSELSSVTARRILDTLDELSSPVRDAKRVPLTTTTTQKRRAETKTPGTLGPPTEDLTIPNVPDLLRLHRRMKLQDSLESARIIASSPAATQGPVSSEYRLQLQQEASRHTNKMTSRRRDLEEDIQEEVHLPNIALPITSLPKFDFVSQESPKHGFKLGKAWDLSLVNNKILHLSEGKLNTSNSEKISALNRIPATQLSISNINFIPSCPSKVNTLTPPTRLKEKPKQVEGNGPIEGSSFGIGVAGELKTGSVMDILGKNKTSFSTKPFENTLKPPATWECNACLVRNKAENSQCMSCKTPRSLAKAPASSTKTPTISLQPTVVTSKAPAIVSGFGIQFKPPVGTWVCEACMVQNKPEASLCVACTTAKPMPKVKATSAGFSSKFLPAGDTWECVTCMVRNKAALEFCTACEGVKPGSGNNLPVLSKPASGFGNMFKKPAGSWECSDCLVMNKEVSKCVACGASKPGMGNASSNNSTTPTLASGDMFRLPEGSWECPDCMLVNKDVWKCFACETTKPGIPGFGDMFKKPEGSWECTACMVSNKNVATKCVACETPKPGILGFGDKFKKPEGSWECPDCMVSNKDVEKCVACKAPKPGTVKASQPIPNTKFNFEIPPEASSFKFGVDKAGDSCNTEVIAAIEVIKPAGASNFKFGSTSSTGDATGFTFGNLVAKNTSTSVPTGFSFGNGVAASKTTSKSEASLPSTALFSFGVPATEKKTQCSENGKIESSLAMSNVTEAKKIVDSVQVNNVKAQATFSFSPIKSDGPPKLQESAPSFKFGAPTAASSLLGTTNAKLNGPTTVTPLTTTSDASNSTPSFGGISKNTLPTTTSAQALFGTSKPSPLFGGSSTTSTPSFGQTATTTPSFGQTATTTPSFGQTTTTTPSFGQTTSTPSSASLFGAQGKAIPTINFVSPTTVGQKRGCNDDEDRVPTGKKQAVGFSSMSGSTSGNGFGSVANTTSLAASSTSASVMSFGSSTKSSEATFKSSTNSSFGSSFSSGSTECTGTGLSSGKAVASTTPFVFGASGGAGGPPPSYSFSTKQESSVPAPATTFGFGAATPATGGFNFSSHTNEKPAGGFSFGSAPSAFGNVSAVAPVFGGVPAAQPPAYPSASGGFNFGGSAQQVPTTSVFSFSANAPAPAFAFGQGATPAPTFDPNARPTFNFTGGEIPQFTAAGTSVQPSPGARRIKKAVRRAPLR